MAECAGDFCVTAETEVIHEPLKKTKEYVESLTTASLESFENLAKNMVQLTEDGGILKQILKNAPEPAKEIGENDYVWINYTGYLEGHDEPFDSTYLRNHMLKTKLCEKKLILGFQYVIPNMKVGELSRFIFAPQYAFFSDDLMPRIPKNSHVMFEIQIMNSLPANEFHSYFDLDREERTKYDLKTVLKIMNNDKERGNNYYKEEKFGRAINVYKECLQIADEHLSSENSKSESFVKMRIDLLNNIATSNWKMNSFSNSLKYANLALKLDKNNLKAQIIKIRTLISSSKLEDAKKCITDAQQIFPRNEMLKQCMIYFQLAKRELDSQMKEFSKAFVGQKDDDLDILNVDDLDVCESFKASVLEMIDFLLANDSLEKHSIQYPDLSPQQIKYFELKAKEAKLYFCLVRESNCIVITLYK